MKSYKFVFFTSKFRIPLTSICKNQINTDSIVMSTIRTFSKTTRCPKLHLNKSTIRNISFNVRARPCSLSSDLESHELKELKDLISSFERLNLKGLFHATNK